MDGFEFLQLSEEISNCQDEFTRNSLARQLIVKTGGKIDSTGRAYWEDEYGWYNCTQAGGQVYFRLKQEKSLP